MGKSGGRFGHCGDVVELVDTHASGACAFGREGSNPFIPTTGCHQRLLLLDAGFPNHPIVDIAETIAAGIKTRRLKAEDFRPGNVKETGLV